MRDQILKNFTKYPKVDHNTYSVARWVTRADSEIVPTSPVQIGGRLEFSSEEQLDLGHFRLSSQGHSVKVRLDQPVGLEGWESAKLSQVLRNGDLMALRVKNVNGEVGEPVIREIDSLELLAPNMKENSVLKNKGFSKGKLWAQYIQEVRNFFVSKGFTEMDTPSLVTCPGMEPELEPFATEFSFGRVSEKLFLPTSPEIHLKKLLGWGWTEIFEIKRCYRNGEISDHHEPEFWLLEWYRGYSNLESIKTDVVNLMGYLTEKGFVQGGTNPPRESSMAELFSAVLNFELTPESTRQDLIQLAKSKEVPFNESDSFDDLFHLLFLIFIEPNFGQRGLEIVYDFPPSQAALARLTDNGWADRFEIYWRGLELGNAFHELNDPKEQKRRWLKDVESRKAKGRTAVGFDHEFIETLESGMPPSGGIAVGLDRLFLACQDLCSLGKIKAFPHGKRLNLVD